jgi:hypothetical protein
MESLPASTARVSAHLTSKRLPQESLMRNLRLMRNLQSLMRNLRVPVAQSTQPLMRNLQPF